ncbi:hypothetical protein B566_EDAN005407 [Ephemera danica]|nr:hypothetical protein B566_EDAN005407 [Ephemera danica]
MNFCLHSSKLANLSYYLWAFSIYKFKKLKELEDSLSSPAGCSSGEESEEGTRLQSSCRASVTILTLLRDRLLTPGEGAMSIHYLGQTFIGDLLPNGKIKSQETDLIFSSPSAWAIHCKKIINPDKKSGCGWASVKYRGRKLDAYKNAYFKKKRLDLSKENAPSEDEEMEKPPPIIQSAPKMVVKHNVLGCRLSNQRDPNTLVESVPFTSLGKIQPFLVTMTSNACLTMDFHSHLTNSEVVGYLAGHWDVNAHNLSITNAFPCRCRLGDRELAPLVEADVWRAMEQRRLTLIGWYHSHPRSPAAPTLRDLDAQLEYQIRMKGPSDATYIPCVGVICSPFYKDDVNDGIQPSIPNTAKVAGGLESSMVCYWVMPPPESRPQEYGRPMLMSYSVTQDQFITQDTLNEMKKCAEFYKGEPDAVQFFEKYNEKVNYLEKLKASVTPKFPRDQSEGIVWAFVRELLALNDPVTPAVASSSQEAGQSSEGNHEEAKHSEVMVEKKPSTSETSEAAAQTVEDVEVTMNNSHQVSEEPETSKEQQAP